MADSKKTDRNLEPHPLVAALQPDPNKPPVRTVKLFGFPGKPTDAATTRLWLDTDLINYVDIPTGAIHYSTTLPDDAGSVVWVAVDAQLAYGSTAASGATADFLSGTIANQQLGRMFPGGGPTPIPPTVLGPCPSLPCPTVAQQCPSLGAICPSMTQICASRLCPSHPLLCHTLPGNCPTVFHCPSHQIICQTHPAVCQSLAQCPSHQLFCNSVLACPSGHALCPSGPVICNGSALTCPTRLCPSTDVPCISAPCPTAVCPSIACGGQGGFGGGL